MAFIVCPTKTGLCFGRNRVLNYRKSPTSGIVGVDPSVNRVLNQFVYRNEPISDRDYVRNV